MSKGMHATEVNLIVIRISYNFSCCMESSVIIRYRMYKKGSKKEIKACQIAHTHKKSNTKEVNNGGNGLSGCKTQETIKQ